MKKIFAIAAFALTFAVVDSKSASAAFIGSYSPTNFTLKNQNADGYVDIRSVPGQITLIGGDNQTMRFGKTDYL